ncbi:uncharacterized protein METZ01_LOCUS24963 [marine metagenome]|uniref:Uncharacterized protein n=1 Tax=marine metagenome TaxID=408172 RepID=A0A381Q1E7_9ZZZZ
MKNPVSVNPLKTNGALYQQMGSSNGKEKNLTIL